MAKAAMALGLRESTLSSAAPPANWLLTCVRFCRQRAFWTI